LEEKYREINQYCQKDEPIDWVSSNVKVVRISKVRICNDPRDLNKAIKSKHYLMKHRDGNGMVLKTLPQEA